MIPRRFAPVAFVLCGTIGLAGWVVASLAGFGSAGIETVGAMPTEEHRPLSLTADAAVVEAPQTTAMADAVVASADTPTTAERVTEMAAGTMVASVQPTSIVDAALPVLSQILPPETPPVQLVTARPDLSPNDIEERSIEILDECFVAEVCIDRYLWTLYQRTPKEDTLKVQEKRKVAVKRKRKTVTVTRTFTKLVPQDFTWKDPHAAEKAGKPMMDYVIGGMDGSFKLKLFHALHAAEAAGLSPGITSAFRDDYRQSIASGLKAATDRSYHGGSFRGGYGHGLAADIVSVKGATKAERWISTEILWKWIDAHGKEFGVGRPYLDRDPPHVSPIDGKEYASRRGDTKVQHAESPVKKPTKLAKRNDRDAGRTNSAKPRKADMRVAARVVR